MLSALSVSVTFLPSLSSVSSLTMLHGSLLWLLLALRCSLGEQMIHRLGAANSSLGRAIGPNASSGICFSFINNSAILGFFFSFNNHCTHTKYLSAHFNQIGLHAILNSTICVSADSLLQTNAQILIGLNADNKMFRPPS